MLPKVSKIRLETTKQGFYFQGFMLLISRKSYKGFVRKSAEHEF